MPETVDNQINQAGGQDERPETLDVYKTNPLFRLRQKIRWLTPKKKLTLLVLPLLLAVITVGLYLALAGPGDPVMRLAIVADDAILENINNQTLQCGQTYTFQLLTDVNPALHNNSQGIVSVGAFLKYDPTVFNSVSIDGSSSAYGTEASQKVDPNNKLIEVVRGQPSPGLNQDNQILAKIKATVSGTYSGKTTLRFYGSQSSDAAELKSVFIENGGKDFEPDYSKAGYDAKVGAYNLNIKCAYCPGEVCGGNEVCPGGWYNESARCCNNSCVRGVELYLEPKEAWVNQGDKFPVELKMRPDVNEIKSMTIILDISPGGILDIKQSDISFSSGVVSGSANVSGNKITLEVDTYNKTNSYEAVLATLNFTGLAAGDADVVFDNGSFVFEGGGGNLIKSTIPGKYHVTKPTVRLCQGTVMTVTPSSNSVDFHWCTDPASTCSISIGRGNQQLSLSDNTDKREHTFTFQDLNTPPVPVDYLYSTYCTKTNYKRLFLDGSFKTLAENLLTISAVQATDITANKATISWSTNQPADSWVYYNIKNDDAILSQSAKSPSAMVTQHSVVLRGLNAATTYEYYIRSATSAGTTCNSPSQSAICSASQKFEFTTKSQRGTADANVILKVDRDRVCDEWLYCNASVQVLDSKQNPPKWQDVCFSVGKCDALDQGGRCVSIVDEEQSQLGALTYEHPREADQIKNLSGYNKIGLDWGASKTIAGYYPYSAMKEVGTPVGIANGSFEDGTFRPWKAHNNGILSNKREGAKRFLRIQPSSAYSGGKLENLASSVLHQGSYVISFRARTDSASIDGQKILVQIGPYKAGGDNKDLYAAFKDPNNSIVDYVTLKDYWQEFVLILDAEVLPANIAGPLNITFVRALQEIDNSAFYLDNVNMKSVLAAADNYLAARSCRMYPTQNAPACDYYDQQANKDYRGWKGYCVETDPGYPARQFANQPMCLNWWPVDVIQGESNIFSDETPVGYTGRKPLYYCLESAGNYPYERELAFKNICTGTEAEGIFWRCSLPGWEHESGTASFDGTKYGLKEADIERIVLKPICKDGVTNCFSKESSSRAYLTLDRSNNWATYFVTSGDITPSLKSWNEMRPLTQSGCGDKVPDDYFAIHAIFEQGKFLWLEAGLCNIGGAYGYVNYKITFYLRETCNVLAQVVTSDGENTPWAARVQEGGWPANDPTNQMSYGYKQDYKPYGAAVQDEPFYDPSAWQEPLYVMPADTTTQAPYQVRAGSPYAIPGTFSSTKKCINSLKQNDPCPSGSNADCAISGQCREFGTKLLLCVANTTSASACTTDNQACPDQKLANEGFKCKDFDTSSGFNWQCAKDTNCAKVSDSCLVQTGECEVTSQFTKNGDVGTTQCIAGSAEDLGKEGCKNNTDCGYTESGGAGLCVGINLNAAQNKVVGGGFAAGQDRLSKLFAKSYGVWLWQWDPAPPAEGGQRMKYVQKFGTAATTDYEWDITKNINIGNPPKVTHIWIDNKDDQDFTIVSQGSAILKFGSWVDPNQAPLVSYSVDWGDGTVVNESGLRINGYDTDDPANAKHILVHYYKYNPAKCNPDNCTCNVAQNYCEYKPKIQIEDNWGKKGSGTFAQKIRVKFQ